MKKLFCDIDNTINNHCERIRRNTINGKCDWTKAWSYEEVMSDIPLPDSIESLNMLSKYYEIHFLTARSFDNVYEITKEWLDKFNFKYTSIIIVNSPIEKITYLTESLDCIFIDDLSRQHETQPPYTVLYWDVIQILNQSNINYYLFQNNWKKIVNLILNR